MPMVSLIAQYVFFRIVRSIKLFNFQLQIQYPSTIGPAQCPPEEELFLCKCHNDFYDDTVLVLDCDSKNLDDQTVSRILTKFLNDETVGPLRTLRLEYNQLTKIPDEILLFSELQEIYLYGNNIKTVLSGSLSFTATEKTVGLGIKIKTIEPGAFVGLFYLIYQIISCFLLFNVISIYRQLWERFCH